MQTLKLLSQLTKCETFVSGIEKAANTAVSPDPTVRLHAVMKWHVVNMFYYFHNNASFRCQKKGLAEKEEGLDTY